MQSVPLMSGCETTTRSFLLFAPPPCFSIENSAQDSRWKTAPLKSIQGCTSIWKRLHSQRLLPLQPFSLSYSSSSFSLSDAPSWHTAIETGTQRRLSTIKGERESLQGQCTRFWSCIFVVLFFAHEYSIQCFTKKMQHKEGEKKVLLNVLHIREIKNKTRKKFMWITRGFNRLINTSQFKENLADGEKEENFKKPEYRYHWYYYSLLYNLSKYNI